jgi:hypothetical protein
MYEYFEDEEYVYVSKEYCRLSLREYLEKYKEKTNRIGLEEVNAKKIMY